MCIPKIKSIKKLFITYRVPINVRNKKVQRIDKTWHLWIWYLYKMELFLYVKCSNFTKYQESSCKNRFRNARDVKIGYWVIMCLFNELQCWFSEESAEMSKYALCPKMKWIWEAIYDILQILSMVRKANRCQDGRMDYQLYFIIGAYEILRYPDH